MLDASLDGDLRRAFEPVTERLQEENNHKVFADGVDHGYEWCTHGIAFQQGTLYKSVQ
jgi:hypothetical protein